MLTCISTIDLERVHRPGIALWALRKWAAHGRHINDGLLLRAAGPVGPAALPAQPQARNRTCDTHEQIKPRNNDIDNTIQCHV